MEASPLTFTAGASYPSVADEQRNTGRGFGKLEPMSDITHILAKIESGDPAATNQLLPLVYDELRRLAAAKLANEKPGQTLQATALVHEAYLRLVDQTVPQQWDNQRHFFAAGRSDAADPDGTSAAAPEPQAGW